MSVGYDDATASTMASSLPEGISEDFFAQQKSFLEAKEQEIKLHEGIYCQFTGPVFETPAEIRMAGVLGADVVGMSTVVEAIAANHMGMKICGISFVSNLAAGISKTALTHEEVQEAANIAAPKFKKLITESVKKFGAVL